MLFLTSEVFISSPSILLTIHSLPPFLLEIITIFLLVVLLALPVPVTDRFMQVRADAGPSIEDVISDQPAASAMSEPCLERRLQERGLDRPYSTEELAGSKVPNAGRLVSIDATKSAARDDEELRRRATIRHLRLDISLEQTPASHTSLLPDASDDEDEEPFKDDLPEPEVVLAGQQDRVIPSGSHGDVSETEQDRVIERHAEAVVTGQQDRVIQPCRHAKVVVTGQQDAREEGLTSRRTRLLKDINKGRRPPPTGEVYNKRYRITAGTRKRKDVIGGDYYSYFTSMAPVSKVKTMLAKCINMWRREPADEKEEELKEAEEEEAVESDVEKCLAHRLKSAPAMTNLAHQSLPLGAHQAAMLGSFARRAE